MTRHSVAITATERLSAILSVGVVTLLPDHEVATVQARLAGHPAIKIVSRDRGGGYGEAASNALPGVIQVADRWHLLENASAAFLIADRESMRPIRAMIGATTINPELLTRAERLDEGNLRREKITCEFRSKSPADSEMMPPTCSD